MSAPRAAVFPHAAIATPHYLASVAGLNALATGGNAADAAVAANLVLSVVCPHLCGVGGDLLALVYREGEVIGLNSIGRLPKAARLPLSGEVPVRGIGAVTVPGAPAGWIALLERFGTMTLKELSAPAVRLAREGVYPSPSLARGIQRSRELLEADPHAKAIFLSEPPLQMNDLADTIEDLQNFYTGRVAEACPAPFDPEDFAAHRSEWVEPEAGVFADCDIYELPPPSRGHLVLRALEILESLDGLTDKDPEFHLRLIRAIDSAISAEGDTVYLCVRDENGMAVSVNESNYMGFGSGVVIPGTGVHLHNRGAYLTPETYVGGARPTHTLSPALAMKGGEPHMIFGTMGGDAQIQIHIQLLARTLVLGQDPAAALHAPRWRKMKNGPIDAEEGLPDIGAVQHPRGDQFGHAHVILKVEGGWAASSDPRSDGLALGY